MYPKVYIVLVNFNGWNDTIECIESVLRSDYSNFQVVVVDNASSDNSMTHMLDWAKGIEYARVENPQLNHLTKPPVTKPIDYNFYKAQEILISGFSHETDLKKPLIFIQSEENKGFAAGNNIGINYSLAKKDADYIWLLNNDTVVEARTLRALVEKAIYYNEHQQRVGIIGVKLLYYNDTRMIQGVAGLYNKWFATTKHLGIFEEDRGQYDNKTITGKITYPIGASMFVSVPFIKDIGLMCEDYFLYFEEIDWALRAKGRYKLAYAPEIFVYHKEGSSIGRHSHTAEYYSFKNRFLFTRKYFPEALPAIYLRVFVTILKRIQQRQWVGAWSIIKIAFHWQR